jgi:hypothetical protein
VAESSLELPAEVVEWIGEVTSGQVRSTKRVPGGASNEAWFVDVDRPDGRWRAR